MSQEDQMGQPQVDAPPPDQQVPDQPAVDEHGPDEKSPADRLVEVREEALDFLEGLLDTMELDGDVAGEITPEGELQITVEGSDGGFLIGRKGRTLEAIQELLRAAVQRGTPGRVKITLDVEGYRDRRKQLVEEKAGEACDRVLEEGGEIEMEPMTAFERKLVHDVVASRDGVGSYSEGQDPRRRVIIHAESE